MNARTSERQLYHRPPVYAFKPGQFEALEAKLREIENATTLTSLSDIAELQLDADGTTFSGGYHYTAASFRQICRTLAAGASTFFRDIGGMTVRTLDQPDLVNDQLACAMFNQLLALRFELLTAFRVIRNEQSKLIEGMVGAKHFTLENSTLNAMVRDLMAASGRDLRFYTGAVVGRKLLLWYRDPQPLFTVRVATNQTWPLYHGYFFCNGEARGTSVRGTTALFTPQGSCLGPYKTYGRRVSHIGRDFNRRLDKMFAFIVGCNIPREELYAGCKALLTTQLGYQGLNEKAQRVHTRLLLRSLSDLHIPQRLAAVILDDAIEAGHDESQMNMICSLDQLRASRRMFDLFAATTRAARGLDVSRRETLEQAAFEMLSQGLGRG